MKKLSKRKLLKRLNLFDYYKIMMNYNIKNVDVIYIDSSTNDDRGKILKDRLEKNGLTMEIVSPFYLRRVDFSTVKAVILAKKYSKALILEQNPNIKFFNIPEASEIASDKWECYKVCQRANIKQPLTYEIPDNLNYPFVVKYKKGSLGAQVFLIHNKKELGRIKAKFSSNDLIYQDYISTSYGRDVRVICMGKKAIAWYIRENKNDFRANIAQGGHGLNFDLPEDFKKMAEKAARTIGLDWCGVDILFGENDEPILCEVNPHPQLNGIEATTGKDLYSEYAKFIKKKLTSKPKSK